MSAPHVIQSVVYHFGPDSFQGIHMRGCLKISFLLTLLLLQAPIFAQSDVIDASWKEISKYSHRLALDSSYEQAISLLGEPRENKKDAQGARNLLWDFEGYTLDAAFDTANKLNSFGIHWYGLSSEIPKFEDILNGEYEVQTKRGTTFVTIQGANKNLLWSIKPIPKSNKNISVLTIFRK